MATYIVCSLEKLLSGFIVIIFLSLSMVASKLIFDPLALFSFKVIKVSILLLVISELSIFLRATFEVIVIFDAIATSSAELAGLKVKFGKVVFVSVPLPVDVLPSI